LINMILQSFIWKHLHKTWNIIIETMQKSWHSSSSSSLISDQIHDMR
jgi:hypothetical protein